jgi:hypothetical protein
LDWPILALLMLVTLGRGTRLKGIAQ